MGSPKTISFVHTNATMVALWRIWLLIEGITRTQAGAIGVSASAPGFPPEAILAGGIAEIIIALFTFVCAGAVVFFRKQSKALIITGLVLHHVFGVFVYLLFTFAIPGYNLSNTSVPPAPFTSLSAYRGAVVGAMFYGGATCFAVQGGTIFFLFALLQSVVEPNDPYDSAYYKSRVGLYGLFVFGGFLFYLVTCGLVADAPLGSQAVVEPIFISNVALNLVSGALGLLIGLLYVLVGYTSILSSHYALVIAIGFGFYLYYLPANCIVAPAV